MSQSHGPAADLDSLRFLSQPAPSVAVCHIERTPGQEWRFTFVNAEFEAVFGLAKGSVLADSTHFFGLLPEVERDKLVLALQNPQPSSASLRLPRDSELQQIDVHVLPRREPNGTVVINAVFVDQTHFHRLESALRTSEGRFRAFMDNSPAIAWVKDAEGRHVYLNRAVENRYGVRLADAIGKTDFELWPHEMAKQFRDNDLRVLSCNHTIHTIETALEADGTLTSWCVFKFPFADEMDRKYVGGIGVDISERERVKAELWRKNVELQEALDQVRRLEESLVTMCAWTRRIQMDGRWVPVEEFLFEKFGVRVSHGISDEALKELQGESNVSAQQIQNQTNGEKKSGNANPPAEPFP